MTRFTLVLLVLGCVPTPASPDYPAECDRACATLTRLGCEEALPTDEGVRCTDVCRAVESAGELSLDPECVANAESCDAARERCGL